MNIPVKDLPSSVYMYDQDYDWSELVDGRDITHLEFRCRHDHIDITPPDCRGGDCACEGRHSFFCPDCENRHLTEHELLEYSLAQEGTE